MMMEMIEEGRWEMFMEDGSCLDEERVEKWVLNLRQRKPTQNDDITTIGVNKSGQSGSYFEDEGEYEAYLECNLTCQAEAVETRDFVLRLLMCYWGEEELIANKVAASHSQLGDEIQADYDGKAVIIPIR